MTDASTAFETVFPPFIAARERRAACDLGVLSDAERGAVTPFATKRAREFAAGRDCAHEALRALGAGQTSIPRAADGSPRWPPGYVGSITHTDGYYAAAAGSAGRYAAIGIDAEHVGRVTPDMWKLIFTASERRRLAAASPGDRARTAAIMFSAKEAFYKCQHPLTGAWIDFDEVSIDVRHERRNAGVFGIACESAQTRERFGSHAFTGRFLLSGELAVTGIYVKTGARSW
jgi:4'-phosphopantetheinyl transferase EntD